MSKIGRKPIHVETVEIEIKGQEVHYKGSKHSGVYLIPDSLNIDFSDSIIKLTPKDPAASDTNMIWGLHRALLSNKIEGAHKGFEKEIHIVGLGYKAIKKAGGLEFALGFSHKIDFAIPEGIDIDVNKTGQKLIVKSHDKELLGLVCSKICDLKPVEPYKGKGIYRVGDIIRRKAGKARV